MLVMIPAALSAPPGAAQGNDFFKARTITIQVGYSAGGTYDLTARLLAQHLPNHIPGRPTIVVKNMPGAGSLRALMYLYELAPRDGTELGFVARSYPTEPALNPAQPKYLPQKFQPIGSTAPEISVAVTWHTSKIRTFDDVLKYGVIAGASSLADDTGRFALIAKNLTGAKIKIVGGYPGGNEVSAAVEKGEVDARFGWSWGSIKSRAKAWLDGKKINLIVQQGLHRAKDLPGVPFLLDYAKTDEDRAALEFLFAPQAAAWPLIAPPDVPRERVQILRNAFRETMEDEAFRAAAVRNQLEIEPLMGDEMEKIVKRISSMPASVIARAKALTAGE